MVLRVGKELELHPGEREKGTTWEKEKENQDEDSGSLLSTVGLFFLLEKRV